MNERADKKLENIMDAAFKLQPDRPSGSVSFYASSAGDGMRKTYFNMISEPYTNPMTSIMAMTFDMGDKIHEVIEQIIKGSGIVGEWVATELRVFDRKNNISGRVDVVINEDGNLIPVEIKSISMFGYKYVEKEPKKEHVWQNTVYMNLMGAPHGYLIYVNKNDSTHLMWKVGFDKKNMEEIEEYFKKCKEFVDAGEVPPMCEGCVDKNNFPAKWRNGSCRWRDHKLCWG